MTIYTIYNDEELLIRPANKEDAQELLQLLNIVGGESDNLTYSDNELGFTVSQEEAFIEGHNQCNNSLLLVAVYKNNIIGTLNFAGGNRPRIAHSGMFGMSVLKEYWGIGVGTCLVDYLLDWAEESDIIKKIELQVKVDNIRAIELYKKMGFTVEGRLRKSLKINEVYYDTLYMGRLLE